MPILVKTAAERSVPNRLTGSREDHIFLALGLVTAPLLAVTPFLQYMGWFLASLSHEMGHVVVAFFFGEPAFPAISLSGHAGAFHQEQLPLLVWVIAVVLVTTGLRFAAAPAAKAVIAGGVCVYLAVAFSPFHDSLRLLAGHGGELIIASIFLWRAATGGFTTSRVERGLYATLGWYLLGRNLILSAGLIFSDAARLEYAGNGSFGMTNDYLRLDLPLPLVAGFMGLVAIMVLPLVLFAASAWNAHGSN